MLEANPKDNEGLPKDGRDFLEKLRARESIRTSSRVAVVVAHPDDESIAFGAQIPKLPACLMVHLTDGVPTDPVEWRRTGFRSREEYAHTRQRELNEALTRWLAARGSYIF